MEVRDGGHRREVIGVARPRTGPDGPVAWVGGGLAQRERNQGCAFAHGFGLDIGWRMKVDGFK